MVKWHLGFLIILTFRPFPPLPPLREPPLPSKTCKTTFCCKPFQKRNRAKEKVKNRGISKAIYGIDKQPHLKRHYAAINLVVKKRSHPHFQSQPLKIQTKSMNISKKFCSPVLKGIRMFNWVLDQVAMYYYFIKMVFVYPSKRSPLPESMLILNWV